MMRFAMAAVVAVFVVAAPVVMAQSQATTWERAFATGVTADAVYFKAHSVDARGTHHTLEAWRDGDRRVHRITDGKVEILAERVGDGQAADYAYEVADRTRGVLHKATGASVVRAGMLWNYWALAHELKYPVGKFELKKLNTLGVVVDQARCEWFEVKQEELPTERVCWSRAFGLPLRIERVAADGPAERVFEMDVVRKIAPSDGEFRVVAKGLRVMELGADDAD